MKMLLNRSDPDFDNWSVKFNGEFLQHATLVSANAALGSVTRFTVADDGTYLGTEETYTGQVRIIERNDAVRDKEPAEVRVVQKGLGVKSASKEEIPAPKEETPAPTPSAKNVVKDASGPGGQKFPKSK